MTVLYARDIPYSNRDIFYLFDRGREVRMEIVKIYHFYILTTTGIYYVERYQKTKNPNVLEEVVYASKGIIH